jgi:antitoxin component YwqK of YwqJK toxin-antitoxin module
MKKILLSVSMLAVIASITGCRTYRHSEVVKETFIHKYGVPVTRDDWTRNGKDGQVVLQKSDGVTVSRTYEKGVLHGKTTYTFPNTSTLQRVETYENGELVSKIENHNTGLPKEEEKYQGQLLTEVIRWYEDGTPAWVEEYENGHIVKGEYRTPLNAVEARVEEGIGMRISRANDGLLLSRDTVRGGLMVERTTFFPSGEPATVTSYDNGVIHGMRMTYLMGGLPSTVEQWANGEQEGTTIVYSNGEKVAEIPYVKGKKNGTELRFRDGRLLVEEVSWKNGVQHGPRKLIADEATTKTEWYLQGEVVSRTTFERMNNPRG